MGKKTEKSTIKEKPSENKKKDEKVCNPKRNRTFLISGIVAITLLCIVGGYFMFQYFYQGKVYPGVKIEGNKIAGMTEEEVETFIENYDNDLAEAGIEFIYNDKTFALTSTVFSLENPEISYEIIALDPQDTAKESYNYGRDSGFITNLGQQFSALLGGKNIELDYEILNEEVEGELIDQFSEFESPAQNASLSFDASGEIEIIDEESGEVFNFDELLNQLKNNVKNLSNEPITLSLEAEEPEVTKAEAEAMTDQVEKIISRAPFKLTYEDEDWEISDYGVQTALEFSPDGVIFELTKISSFFDEIAEDVDVPVKEGKFEVVGSENITLKEIQEPENGMELNYTDSVSAMNENIIKEDKESAELVVDISLPNVSPDNVDELGIKELLGTGQTNMSGSPSNRIFNITKGADILNGLLIAPDEELSLITALGEIDGDHGWLPELVIKENKTIPEFGGGLCQIGTTTFRMAMNSGMEILERRNHSYVVSYYNYNGKPGVDATIYDPKPDFRFENDTGNWVLLQTRIEGSDIYFDLWGTSDGREGYFKDPENYNFVSAPPTVEIETDELAPGQRDCSEKAHNGVSAAFDYIIVRPDGEEEVTTFTSKYKALPAVCRVGKEEEKPAEEAPAEETKEEETKPEEKEDTVREDDDKKKNDKKKSS